MPARRFEDLSVWQAARELTRGVYRATQTQKLRSDNVLVLQMRRAAVSVCSNLAEGYERGTRKQQIEFGYVAKGSAGELRSQIINAFDAGLLSRQAYVWLHERSEALSKQLHAYLRHLKASSTRYPGAKFQAETDPSG